MKEELDEEYKKVFLADLQSLIKVPSLSFPEGGEEGCIQKFIAEKMKKIGVRVRTLEVKDVPGCLHHPLWCGPERNYRDRPTVIGEIGPVNTPALIIMAHSDTVQLFYPEKWNVDPFGGVIKDGRIYGLGAGDDKWGIAAMLTVIRAVLNNEEELKKRLIFISTIDEENGVSNGLLLLTLAGIKGESVFYLDGCESKITIGNPGGSNLYIRPVKDIPSEVFDLHERLLNEECKKESKKRIDLFNIPFFCTSQDIEKSFVFYKREDSKGPFFLVAFYMPPGETKESLCRRLEDMICKVLGKDIELYKISYRIPWFEPSITSPDVPFVKYLADSIKEVTQGEPVINIGGKQDSFIFRNYADIPTVSFGVSRIAEDGFHKPNENIYIDEAWDGCKIVYKTVKKWLEN